MKKVYLLQNMHSNIKSLPRPNLSRKFYNWICSFDDCEWRRNLVIEFYFCCMLYSYLTLLFCSVPKQILIVILFLLKQCDNLCYKWKHCFRDSSKVSHEFLLTFSIQHLCLELKKCLLFYVVTKSILNFFQKLI